MRHWFCSFFSATLLLLTPVAVWAMTYQQWVSSTQTALEQSPEFKSLLAQSIALKTELDAVKHESPLTLQTQVQREDTLENNLADGTWHEGVFKAQGSVKYELKNSLAAELGVSVGRTSLIPALSAIPTTSPLSVNFKLDYDLVHGGTNGLKLTQQQQEVWQVKQKLAQAQEKDLETRLGFHAFITRSFINHCKLTDYNKVQTVVDQNVKAAQARLKALTLSNKDYLIFLDLKHSVARQITYLKMQQHTLQDEAHSWGDAMVKALGNLQASAVQCSRDTDDRTAGVDQARIPDSKFKDLATRLPAYQEAIAARQIETLEAQRVSLENKMSFKPFVEILSKVVFEPSLNAPS